jgi:hypothetical protein
MAPSFMAAGGAKSKFGRDPGMRSTASSTVEASDTGSDVGLLLSSHGSLLCGILYAARSEFFSSVLEVLRFCFELAASEASLCCKVSVGIVSPRRAFPDLCAVRLASCKAASMPPTVLCTSMWEGERGQSWRNRSAGVHNEDT